MKFCVMLKSDKIIVNCDESEIKDGAIIFYYKNCEIAWFKVSEVIGYWQEEGVLPSKPKGSWIYKKEDNWIGNHYWCSVCETPQNQLYANYCAYCGAEMGNSEEVMKALWGGRYKEVFEKWAEKIEKGEGE